MLIPLWRNLGPNTFCFACLNWPASEKQMSTGHLWGWMEEGPWSTIVSWDVKQISWKNNSYSLWIRRHVKHQQLPAKDHWFDFQKILLFEAYTQPTGYKTGSRGTSSEAFIQGTIHFSPKHSHWHCGICAPLQRANEVFTACWTCMWENWWRMVFNSWGIGSHLWSKPTFPMDVLAIFNSKWDLISTQGKQ